MHAQTQRRGGLTVQQGAGEGGCLLTGHAEATAVMTVVVLGEGKGPFVPTFHPGARKGAPA